MSVRKRLDEVTRKIKPLEEKWYKRLKTYKDEPAGMDKDAVLKKLEKQIKELGTEKDRLEEELRIEDIRKAGGIFTPTHLRGTGVVSDRAGKLLRI